MAVSLPLYCKRWRLFTPLGGDVEVVAGPCVPAEDMNTKAKAFIAAIALGGLVALHQASREWHSEDSLRFVAESD